MKKNKINGNTTCVTSGALSTLFIFIFISFSYTTQGNEASHLGVKKEKKKKKGGRKKLTTHQSFISFTLNTAILATFFESFAFFLLCECLGLAEGWGRGGGDLGRV